MSVGRKTKTTRGQSWYSRHTPKKRWHRVLIISGGSLLAIIIAFQLAWPAERGLPLARVADQSLVLADYEAMASVIVDKFGKSEVELKIGGDKTIKVALKDTGAEPNTEKMIE